jgi:hypothetical protein
LHFYNIDDCFCGRLSKKYCSTINNKKMKVLLDIKDRTKAPFLMELLNSLDYIKVVKEVEEQRKNQFISDLMESFEDIRLHEQGKKSLKTLKEVINEL